MLLVDGFLVYFFKHILRLGVLIVMDSDLLGLIERFLMGESLFLSFDPEVSRFLARIEDYVVLIVGVKHLSISQELQTEVVWMPAVLLPYFFEMHHVVAVRE